MELSEKETGLQYLETLLRYLLTTIKDKDMDNVKEILEKTLSEKKGGPIMATIAQQFIMDKAIVHLNNNGNCLYNPS